MVILMATLAIGLTLAITHTANPNPLLNSNPSSILILHLNPNHTWRRARAQTAIRVLNVALRGMWKGEVTVTLCLSLIRI